MGGRTSTKLVTTCGVRQGSKLRSLLFIMIMDNIAKKVFRRIEKWGEILKKIILNIKVKKTEIMTITNQPQSRYLRMDEESIQGLTKLGSWEQ